MRRLTAPTASTTAGRAPLTAAAEQRTTAEKRERPWMPSASERWRCSGRTGGRSASERTTEQRREQPGGGRKTANHRTERRR